LTHSQTSPTIQLKLKKTANTLARSLARVVASVTLTRLFLLPLEMKSNKFDLEKISPLSLSPPTVHITQGLLSLVRVCSRYVYNIRANRMCKCVTANRGGGLRFCGLRVPTGSPAAIKILLALICFSFSFCG
jgi:hypothetical protein